MKNLVIGLLGLLLAAIVSGAGAQEVSQGVSVGRVALVLPVPPDYVSAGGIPRLQAIAEASTQSSHRLLVALFLKREVDAWQAGDSSAVERYFFVQTEKQIEQQSMPKVEFAGLKRALKQRVAQNLKGEDAGLEKQRTAHQRELDANMSALQKKLSTPPMTIRLGETVILGIVDEQASSISTASATRIAGTADGRALEATLVSVSTALYVKGKLLNIYGYARYQSPDDLRWLENESRMLVEQLVGANR